jgi:hypothetical protein
MNYPGMRDPDTCRTMLAMSCNVEHASHFGVYSDPESFELGRRVSSCQTGQRLSHVSYIPVSGNYHTSDFSCHEREAGPLLSQRMRGYLQRGHHLLLSCAELLH